VRLADQVIAIRPVVFLGSSISGICNAMARLVEANGPVKYCFSSSISAKPGGYVFTSQIDGHDRRRAARTARRGVERETDGAAFGIRFGARDQ